VSVCILNHLRRFVEADRDRLLAGGQWLQDLLGPVRQRRDQRYHKEKGRGDDGLLGRPFQYTTRKGGGCRQPKVSSIQA
jgi:hypothetical protein